MQALHGRCARRITALIAALAFLLGGNYCVLAALSGHTRMACLSVPAVSSPAAVPSCHHAAPAAGDHSKPPAAKPSCCPDPAVAPSPSAAGKMDAAAGTIASAILAAWTAPAAPSAIDRHGHRPAPDGQPPPRLARAPAPARAPPLA